MYIPAARWPAAVCGCGPEAYKDAAIAPINSWRETGSSLGVWLVTLPSLHFGAINMSVFWMLEGHRRETTTAIFQAQIPRAEVEACV